MDILIYLWYNNRDTLPCIVPSSTRRWYEWQRSCESNVVSHTRVARQRPSMSSSPTWRPPTTATRACKRSSPTSTFGHWAMPRRPAGNGVASASRHSARRGARPVTVGSRQPLAHLRASVVRMTTASHATSALTSAVATAPSAGNHLLIHSRGVLSFTREYAPLLFVAIRHRLSRHRHQ